jgi:hypothetical protein
MNKFIFPGAKTIPVIELKTNDCPFETFATSTLLNVPKDILEEGATTNEAVVLFAGFRDTFVADVLVIVTIVAIIV